MDSTRPFFVFGCQRSGTTITVDVFRKCDQIEVYPETDPRANQAPLQDVFTEDVRLRSKEDIDRLIKQSPRPAILFKPLMDCHYADKILDRHKGKGIWMYRHFADVANSAVAKWGNHQRNVVQAIHHDNWSQLGWRAERLPAHRIKLVKSLWHPDLSDHEGAAIFWLMRNWAYFDHAFHARRDLKLFRYEEVVAAPESSFRSMMDFMELTFESDIVADVHSQSVSKSKMPSISGEILDHCDNLLRQLDAACRAQAN